MNFAVFRKLIQYGTYIILAATNKYSSWNRERDTNALLNPPDVENQFLETYNFGNLEWQNFTEPENGMSLACMVNFPLYIDNVVGEKRCRAGLKISIPETFQNTIRFRHITVPGDNVQPNLIFCICELRTNAGTTTTEFIIAKKRNFHNYFQFQPAQPWNNTRCTFNVVSYFEFAHFFAKVIEDVGQYRPT